MRLRRMDSIRSPEVLTTAGSRSCAAGRVILVVGVTQVSQQGRSSGGVPRDAWSLPLNVRCSLNLKTVVLGLFKDGAPCCP